MVPEGGGFGPELLVIRGQHAALAAGGNDLVMAEGKRGYVPHGADFDPANAGAMGLGAVLDKAQPALLGQGSQPCHVAGPACQVNRYDRAGGGSQRGADRLGGDVLAVQVNIGENRFGAAQSNAVGGGDERARGDNDFIARPYPQSSKAQLQAYRAVGDRQTVLGAAVSGKFLFEGAPFRAVPVVSQSRFQHPRDSGLRGFVVHRPWGEGKRHGQCYCSPRARTNLRP